MVSPKPLPHDSGEELRLETYLRLADAAGRERDWGLWNKALALATLQAQKTGHVLIAETCRQRLGSRQPHHIFEGFRSVGAALQSPIVTEYLDRLVEIYPPEKASYLLSRYRALGYRGDHEFAHHFRKRNAPRLARLPEEGSRSTARIAKPSEEAGLAPLPFEWPLEESRKGRGRVVWVAVLAGVLGIAIGVVASPQIRAWWLSLSS